MQVRCDVSLKRHNTLQVDAVAEYFCSAESDEDIQYAIDYAQEKSLDIKVLGGGSNVVMSSRVQGLVLLVNSAGVHVVKQDDVSVYLKVAAGENWHEFVMWSLSQGYYGLENLALIPGSVGAAPVQNIGAYGVEVERFICKVEAFDLRTGELKEFDRTECQFAYRESIFKNECDGHYVIANVVFRLNKQADVKVEYAPLNQMTEEQGLPTPLQLAQWVIDVRNQKLPNPSELPNAGSFFKNPVVSNEKFRDLEQQYPSMPHYVQEVGVKLPAGWLIDQLGLKGHSFGYVRIHDKQALVLINQGGTAEDIANATKQIKQKVKQVYGIELEQEPRMFA
ncbi:UDP-N-acetylmuramate dehydrogenase [Bermanella marisrubri]|uniref:UDP-N-acetylenolpyruvoylglucosamine reductase n=1 Tax=Bermanella marisrubri TaxID=207949 RepID=Q1N4V8_9GAMM|nr:UDP-N-acetylmuramate dehydrogenase [Bermanella marisrubri]EAT13320.1 UDP-N-acetylpyruvoylglucosamine reductase [Oceanobacter sp. RED65] [Bermanella marisrubri]QIZ84080.1 UDP-N-acetylmuramate dehydrogenase [Bermanella marisrubri]